MELDPTTGLAAFIDQYQDYIAGLVGLMTAFAFMVFAHFER